MLVCPWGMQNGAVCYEHACDEHIVGGARRSCDECVVLRMHHGMGGMPTCMPEVFGERDMRALVVVSPLMSRLHGRLTGALQVV